MGAAATGADERAGESERAGERAGSRGKNARTVVAILGAAHLNGVQARLLSGGAGDALETHMPEPNGASLGPSLVVSW